MAVTEFHLMVDRSGNSRVERKGALTEINNRRFVMKYTVLTDNISDGPDIIRRTYGIPKVGDSYQAGNDSDPAATCVNVDIKATESPYAWILEAEYDTDRLVTNFIDNPLNIPPEIQWSFAKYERVMVRDILGVPLVNSSTEWFDPPIVAEDSRPVLTITRNERSFSPANAVAYQDACNYDNFAGVAPRQAKITSITGVKQIDVGFQYWKVTYEIEFRRETFDTFVLDQGYRDANRKLFLDPLTATPMSNPTLMNGKGARLTDATTTLAAGCTANDTQITVVDGATLFPIGPSYPPHYYFEVRIEAEVLRVVGGFGTNNWNVVRGYAGTTPAAHGAVAVTMEPYFLRFLPHKVLPFAPLNLPVI